MFAQVVSALIAAAAIAIIGIAAHLLFRKRQVLR